MWRLTQKDNGGFSAVGSCVAILLVLALLFGAAQAYWVGSRSGQIQYVADAGALAADEVVAEYVTYAQVADAVLFSMSALGLVTYAVSAVAAFIPGGEGVAAKLADVGTRIFKGRDSFRKSAAKGLDAFQKALPVLCTAKAMSCVSANARCSGVEYVGAALPLPLEGESLSLSKNTAAKEASQDIEETEKDVTANVKQQQQSQKKADEALERAWKADCGNSGMCMRERASKLAGLSGALNPNYSLVDAWSFKVALNRAKAYYAARYEQEPGANSSGSPEEIGESVARKRFYAFALKTVSKGSASKSSDGSQSAHLQALPRNIKEVKNTELYTERVYPVSVSGGTKTLHAYKGCPGAEGQWSGSASVQDIDSGEVHVCEQCQFSAKTLGRVPSASTSISNGFEYYYRIVVQAAQDYSDASEDLSQSSKALDNSMQSIAGSLKKGLKKLAAQRIDPQPPGRYGCICIVVAKGSSFSLGGVFTGASVKTGTRVAISGATLAGNSNAESGNALTQLGSNLLPQSSLAGGLVKTVFGAWGTLLQGYGNGVTGVTNAFKKTLGAIPLVGTALSDKASTTFTKALEDVGLQPVNTKAYAPVLVNTSHILKADGSTAARLLLVAEKLATKQGEGQLDALSLVVEGLESSVPSNIDLSKGRIVIASIDLSSCGLGTGTKELSVPIPSKVLSTYKQTLAQLQSCLENL